jgi:DNA modification methylase
LHADGSHQHEKPVDWIRLLVGNCTYGLVVDGFCGSGTTIIACEQLGRKCRAIEISPGYVAVALQRWADATGKQPKRITANRYYTSKISTPVGMICLRNGVDCPEFAVIF